MGYARKLILPLVVLVVPGCALAPLPETNATHHASEASGKAEHAHHAQKEQKLPPPLPCKNEAKHLTLYLCDRIAKTTYYHVQLPPNVDKAAYEHALGQIARADKNRPIRVYLYKDKNAYQNDYMNAVATVFKDDTYVVGRYNGEPTLEGHIEEV